MIRGPGLGCSLSDAAAASIGQVHAAETATGRPLAVKIQYPGVAKSIDSDVDNVATLLNLFRILPDGLDIGPLLDEAKRQLHVEADYREEAASLGQFARHLEGDPRFEVPTVVEELSDGDVLAMQFLDGRPIESLDGQPKDVRDTTSVHLVQLALHELFDWGLVQTDPNFANYLFDPGSGRIQLLDFGATRRYDETRRRAVHRLLVACVEGDDGDVERAAAVVGYTDGNDPRGYTRSVVQLLRTATEPVRDQRPFPFRNTDLAQRMSEVVIDMRVREKFGRLPPTEVLFLHRKLGGLYLLLSRLAATLPVRTLLAPHLDERSGDAASVAHAAGRPAARCARRSSDIRPRPAIASLGIATRIGSVPVGCLYVRRPSGGVAGPHAGRRCGARRSAWEPVDPGCHAEMAERSRRRRSQARRRADRAAVR